MKNYLLSIQLGITLIMCCFARAQGTLQVDQQSYTTENTPSGIVSIQPEQPMGQSFIPTLSSIEFIQLYMSDQTFNGVGSTVLVNLWSDSIGSGTFITSTDPVFIVHGSFAYVNFFFSTPITVTPGTTYYFQPFIQSGDSDQNMTTGVTIGSAYQNGTALYNGTANNTDLLFREGIVVPEPSPIFLSGLGLAVVFFNRQKKSK
jgi:hypothetical protein